MHRKPPNQPKKNPKPKTKCTKKPKQKPKSNQANKKTPKPKNPQPSTVPPLPENATIVTTSHRPYLGCCLPVEPCCIPYWKVIVTSKLQSSPQKYETSLHTKNLSDF